MTYFEVLQKLYKLLDINDFPTIIYGIIDNEWTACLFADGKLIISDCHGLGSTPEEAIEDAISRFIDHTPVINDVPLKKIIAMLNS